MSGVESALVRADAALLAGDGLTAMRLARDAQRLEPNSPQVGLRLLEGCLLTNTLLCAAHGARSVLRALDAEDPDLCRYLGSARAFGTRASRIHWCPIGEPCVRVTNRTRDAAISAGSGMDVDDGQLWSGENFVSALKAMLADDRQWRGEEDYVDFNHATMQQMQGNREAALQLYTRALAVQPNAAHAYGNLAVLERGPRARAHLETALKLDPGSPAAGERWLDLASIHWQHRQPGLAHHALRRALRLRPHSAFGHAIAAELHSGAGDATRASESRAKADELQRARAPQLPACARWTALLPALPARWGGTPVTPARSPPSATSGRDGGAEDEGRRKAKDEI